jgi:hypothetical protein
MAQRFYDPAWRGTMTILETASRTPSVRRVVITSSVTIDTALGNILNCPKMTAQVLLKDVAGMHLFALNPKVVHNLENLVVVANDGRGIP